MKIGLLLLVGLPGSGKTTLAKNLVSNSESISGNRYNFIHICYDDFIQFPNGNYEFEYKLARNSISAKIENLVKVIKDKAIDFCPSEFKTCLQSIKCWESGFVLILDDNMYFKSMRYSIFQIAKKHSISFCQVYLKCSLNMALSRNSLRKPEDIVLSHVIENMHSKIEPPNCQNNWEKYSIELNEFDNFSEICKKLSPVLNDSLDNFFYSRDDSEEKELSKVQCQKSVLHQTDLGLRKIINSKIKKYLIEGSKKEESKEYIARFNSRKSEILSDIKAGNICLPDEVLEEINSDVLEKFQLMNFLESYF